MNVLIGQPKLEPSLRQLEDEMKSNPDIDLIFYPEGYINDNVEEACQLAKTYQTSIVSGYKKPKDRAIIINRQGDIVLDRAKYEASPVVQLEGLKIGFILCDELVLQGLSKLEGMSCDLIFHPIGVGMFSEEQFEEWIQTAAKLAKQSGSMLLGASHANGAYRDSDVSIPIAYGMDGNGEPIFISKNDTESIRFNVEFKRVLNA